MDTSLLKILCCPETRQSLRLANKIELENLNTRIHLHSAFNNPSGKKLIFPISPLSAALIREDGQVAYPIRDDIPFLLVEEAIATS